MDFNASEIFGSGSHEHKEDPRNPIILLLEALARMLDSKRDPDHVQRPSEEKSDELPVRPRVEPIGGG